jgi:hypothetical protein
VPITALALYVHRLVADRFKRPISPSAWMQAVVDRIIIVESNSDPNVKNNRSKPDSGHIEA